MSKKLPFLQLYIADYVRDTRILSLEARAIWMDMLCLMHDSDRRGYLVSRSGCPFSTEQIASFAGCSLETATRVNRELIDSGVVSCTGDGILFSRRMVRDEKKRGLCSEAGRKGGNPTLKGQSKGGVKGRDKPPIASSSNALDGDRGAGERGQLQLPVSIDTSEFREALERWIRHRMEIKHPVKPTMLSALLKKCSEWGSARSIRAIDHTILMGWQGLREPEEENRGNNAAKGGNSGGGVGSSSRIRANPGKYAAASKKTIHCGTAPDPAGPAPASNGNRPAPVENPDLFTGCDSQTGSG